jgi:uncharacterized protein
MRRILFLDTSFVIALVDRTDRHHPAARSWNKRIRAAGWPIVTTLAVISELGDAFGKRGHWPRLAPIFDWLPDRPRVDAAPVTHELICSARDLQDRRLDKRWGLTDCISFIVMGNRGLTQALTADDDFRQAGYRALLLETAEP